MIKEKFRLLRKLCLFNPKTKHLNINCQIKDNMVEIPTNITLEIVSLFTDLTIESLNISQIAKKVKKRHTSILPHINELEKASVLSTKIKGRNKEVFINKNSINSSYYLLMAETFKVIKSMKKYPIIKKICEETRNCTKTILVFGSYAKGIAQTQSDIDVIVISKKSKEIDNIMNKISQTYGKEINVKYISKINPKDHLTYEIIKNHLIIRGSDIFISEVLKNG
jgi:predicted nucleotidyltransferase